MKISGLSLSVSVSATNSPLEDCLSLFPVVRLTSICLFCALNGSCTHVWFWAEQTRTAERGGGGPVSDHGVPVGAQGCRSLAAVAGRGSLPCSRCARSSPRRTCSSVRSVAVGSAARALSATFAGLRRAARGLLARFVFQRVGCRAEVLASTAAKTGRPSSSVGDSLERDGPSSGVTAAGTRAPLWSVSAGRPPPLRGSSARGPGRSGPHRGPERGQAACLSVSCCLERLGIAFKSFGFSSFLKHSKADIRVFINGFFQLGLYRYISFKVEHNSAYDRKIGFNIYSFILHMFTHFYL